MLYTGRNFPGLLSLKIMGGGEDWKEPTWHSVEYSR
jgi:hypothetical protein